MWQYTYSVITLEQISTEWNTLLECTQTSGKHRESKPWRYLLGGLGESLLPSLLYLVKSWKYERPASLRIDSPADFVRICHGSLYGLGEIFYVDNNSRCRVKGSKIYHCEELGLFKFLFSKLLYLPKGRASPKNSTITYPLLVNFTTKEDCLLSPESRRGDKTSPQQTLSHDRHGSHLSL